MLVTVALGAAGRNDDDDNPNDLADCDTPATEVLQRPLDEGYAIERLPASEESRALGLFPDATEEKLELRQVVQDGERAGIVYTVPGADPHPIANGMEDGVKEQGGEPERSEVPLASGDAEQVIYTLQGQQLVALIGKNGCVAFVVLGAERPDVKSVADSLSAE
jgi:hypothetical protein